MDKPPSQKLVEALIEEEIDRYQLIIDNLKTKLSCKHDWKFEDETDCHGDYERYFVCKTCSYQFNRSNFLK